MKSVAGLSLSSYIKILVQREACDWRKREAELRVAERVSHSREGGEAEMEADRQEEYPDPVWV